MINVERLNNQVSLLLHRDATQQWRGVHLYMEKIRGEIGDILAACSELIKDNTELMFDDYLVLYSMNDGLDNAILLSFYILSHYKWSEIDEYMDNHSWFWMFSEVEKDTMCTNIFKICRNVCKHPLIWEGLHISELEYDSFVHNNCKVGDIRFMVYTFSVFLYIALKNELVRIKEQAYIEGVSLPAIDEGAPISYDKAQGRGGDIIPPNNNLTYDEREAVFTERALKYYKKAIEKGYIELTPTHYKWLYGGKQGKVRCGVFLLRIYCPNNTEQLPERALHKLFDIERLDSTITGFINTNKKQRWLSSIDEMFDD